MNEELDFAPEDPTEVPGQDDESSTSFVDSSGTLRLWVNEDATPIRMTLSRYWRDQLKRDTFEGMCGDVFSQLSAALPAQVETPQTTSSDAVPSDRDAILDELAKVSDDIDRYISAKDGYGRWQGDGVTRSTAKGHVSVTISMYGRPTSATVDRDWALSTSGSTICQSIIKAWREGLAHVKAPVYEPGELDRLSGRMQQLSAALLDHH